MNQFTSLSTVPRYPWQTVSSFSFWRAQVWILGWVALCNAVNTRSGGGYGMDDPNRAAVLESMGRPANYDSMTPSQQDEVDAQIEADNSAYRRECELAAHAVAPSALAQQWATTAGAGSSSDPLPGTDEHDPLDLTDEDPPPEFPEPPGSAQAPRHPIVLSTPPRRSGLKARARACSAAERAAT